MEPALTREQWQNDGYEKTLLWNAKRPGSHAGGPNPGRNQLPRRAGGADREVMR